MIINQKLKVSTVTPVYNNAPYLESCIQSLLEQNYDYYECIFVDDGSTDGSVEILRQYEQHPRVKVIYKPRNEGISSAYRTGLPYVSGDIICLLDADDIASPNRLGITAAHFQNNEQIGILYSAIDLINPQGESYALTLELPAYVNNNNLFMHLFRRGIFIGTGMAYRHFPWIKIDKDIICNDYYIAIQLVSEGYQFAYVPDKLTSYRIHGHNTSDQSQRLIQDIYSIQKMYDYSELARKWMQSGCNKAELLTTLGINSYYFKKEYLMAKQHFEEAIQEGGNLESYFYLGNLMYGEQRYQEAYRYFKEAYLQEGDFFHVEHNLGIMTAVYLGDCNTAIKMLERAGEKQPYYLLIQKNIYLLQHGHLKDLKLIHFLADEDAIYNSYCRLIQQQKEIGR